MPFQWVNIAYLYLKSHRLKFCRVIESADGFQFNQFFQSKKELQNYNKKIIFLSAPKIGETEPTFQTVIFQNKLTLLQIKLITK